MSFSCAINFAGLHVIKVFIIDERCVISAVKSLNCSWFLCCTWISIFVLASKFGTWFCILCISSWLKKPKIVSNTLLAVAIIAKICFLTYCCPSHWCFQSLSCHWCCMSVCVIYVCTSIGGWGRELLEGFVRMFFFFSPVAYLFDTSDWKNQCIGLNQPGDLGWLMYHHTGWGHESQ